MEEVKAPDGSPPPPWEQSRKDTLAKDEIQKQRYSMFLLAIVGIELAVIFSLLRSSSNLNVENANNVELSNLNLGSLKNRLFDYKHDTVDVVGVSLLRWMLVVPCGLLMLSWGTSKRYEADSGSPDKDTSVSQNFLAKMMQLLYTRVHPQKTPANGDATEAKSRETSSGKWVRVNDAEDELKVRPKDPQDIADFWKLSLWLASLLLSAACQTYIGIKATLFEFEFEMYHGAVFAVLVLLGHIELYLAKEYIDLAVQPQDKYFCVQAHQHPVYKRQGNGQWCDLCYEDIQGAKIGYKCPPCEVMICASCWKNHHKTGKEAASEYKELDLRQYLTQLTEFYEPHKFRVIITGMCIGGRALLDTYQPDTHGQIVNNVVEGNFDKFWWTVKMNFLIMVVTSIFGAIENYLTSTIEDQVESEVQRKLFTCIMHQDTSFFDLTGSENLNTQMGSHVNEMLSPYKDVLSTFVNDGIGLFGGLYLCLYTSWKLALLSLACVAPLSYIQQQCQDWEMAAQRALWSSESAAWTLVYDSLDNHRTVRAFARERRICHSYNQLRQKMERDKSKQIVMESVESTTSSVFSLFQTTLVTWFGGLLVLNPNDPLQIGSLMAFEMMWGRVENAWQQMVRIPMTYSQGKFVASHILTTLQTKPKIERLDLNDGIHVDDLEGDIVLEDVHFNYDTEMKKDVIRGASLRIKKGAVTALVGRSGGGKTTIMNLLLRLYDPDSGRIMVADKDLRDIHPFSWRQLLGIVQQDTPLFSKSILYNIVYGVDEFRQEDVDEATRLANAYEFIQEYEDGYYAQIGQKGTQLSGGQTQRVAIARMLMKKPRLMLLDEATSSLDTESESLVQSALEKAIELNQSTVVLIAHRLSTVVGADKIAVVDKGAIVEEGTHEELVERGGLYAKLVSRQLDLQKRFEKKREKSDGGGDDIEEEPTDTIDSLMDQLEEEGGSDENGSDDEDGSEDEEGSEDEQDLS